MTAIGLCPRAAFAFPQPPPLGLLRAALASRLRALTRPARLELRIDVSQPDERIETELDTLHRRLHTPGDALHACTLLPALLPNLTFHHREADGEHYVYVEDNACRCLAGYTVFNRLIEVDRRTDRLVRSPHSKYAPAYQGRGIATAVYEWALGRGLCLVSGARQSAGAHALWHALARRHPLRWITLHARRMHDLGDAIPSAGREALDTRMLLAGQGWSIAELRERGLLHPAASA